MQLTKVLGEDLYFTFNLLDTTTQEPMDLTGTAFRVDVMRSNSVVLQSTPTVIGSVVRVLVDNADLTNLGVGTYVLNTFLTDEFGITTHQFSLPLVLVHHL